MIIKIDPTFARKMFPHFTQQCATECSCELTAIHYRDIIAARAGSSQRNVRQRNSNSLHSPDSHSPDYCFASAIAALPEMAGDSLPADIQVFPPGKEVEFTLQDFPGETFKLDVDASVAAKAQADLERLAAAEQQGRGSAPFADKNHEDSEATFHPLRFFWAGNDPKTGGVRVAANWTPFGAQLVRAKAFKYFSGNFLFNKATKKFLGLINENIGGLVNRPGFASQQAFAKADTSNHQNQNIMTKEEISQIVTEAIKPLSDKIVTLEASAKGATPAAAVTSADDKIVQLVTAALKPLQDEVKGLRENNAASVQAAAKATVQTLGVKSGRIAAQDAETIKFWEDSIAANAKAADALTKIPVNPALATIIANASAGGTSTATEGQLGKDKATSDKIEAKARAHMANSKLPFDQAWAKATEEVMAGK